MVGKFRIASQREIDNLREHLCELCHTVGYDVPVLPSTIYKVETYDDSGNVYDGYCDQQVLDHNRYNNLIIAGDSLVVGRVKISDGSSLVVTNHSFLLANAIIRGDVLISGESVVDNATRTTILENCSIITRCYVINNTFFHKNIRDRVVINGICCICDLIGPISPNGFNRTYTFFYNNIKLVVFINENYEIYANYSNKFVLIKSQKCFDRLIKELGIELSSNFKLKDKFKI